MGGGGTASGKADPAGTESHRVTGDVPIGGRKTLMSPRVISWPAFQSTTSHKRESLLADGAQQEKGN